MMAHGVSEVREPAALQLKNMLTSEDIEVRQEYHERWLSFPMVARALIKNNLLLALDMVAAKWDLTAQCVPCVALIELPVDHWSELMAVLVSKITAAHSIESV